MSESILIYGGTKKSREEWVLKKLQIDKLEEKTDIKILQKPKDKKSIGIAETRKASKFMQEKPLEQQNKYLIILDAQILTREAQNSLLKLLEEPPGYAIIILSAKKEKDLLETVISRCKKVQISTKGPSDPERLPYSEIIALTPGERLDWVKENYKEEKEDLIEILESWVQESRGNVEENATNIGHILKILEALENTNVNKRLALETLILKLI